MKQKIAYNNENGSIEVRPRVSNEQVKEIAVKHYGLEMDPGYLPKEMDSYCDRNFLIQGKLKKSGVIVEQHKDSGAFILKVFNASYTDLRNWNENIARIVAGCYKHCENQFKLALPLCGLGDAKMITVVDMPLDQDVEVSGCQLEELPSKTDIVTVKNGVYYSRHLARLNVFIPGKTVNAKTMSAKLTLDFGKCAGVLDLALKNVAAPEIDTRETWEWNIINVTRERYDEFINSLEDDEKITMCRGILERFEQEVMSKLKALPKQWIHNDLHHMNFITSNLENSKYDKIIGIIDFDDVIYSHGIVDFTGMLMFLTAMCSVDQCMKMAKHLSQGYMSVVKLSKAEVGLLYDLILVQYVKILSISEYQYKHADTKNEYMLTFANAGWSVLRYLLALGEREFLRIIQEDTSYCISVS